VELIPSGGGVFEIAIDGELVFSKRQQNRFPEDDEIFAFFTT
jgi:selenoprotein W-related protein